MVGPATRLLPIEVCQGVLAAIDAEPATTGEKAALALAETLLAYYAPIAEKPAGDEEVARIGVVLVALTKIFASYPYSLGKRVIDPVKGLPSKLKFRPKPADLVEALEAEKKRRDTVRANALSHMQEREERQRVAEAEASYAKNKLSPEERAAQVRALLKAREA